MYDNRGAAVDSDGPRGESGERKEAGNWFAGLSLGKNPRSGHYIPADVAAIAVFAGVSDSALWTEFM